MFLIIIIGLIALAATIASILDNECIQAHKDLKQLNRELREKYRSN
jgi:hypothetical protein